MGSIRTTNILLILIAAILAGSIAVTTLYAVPVYLSIAHEADVEMAREYRAAEEVHATNWKYMVDRVFVVRCNSDQATQGDSE